MNSHGTLIYHTTATSAQIWILRKVNKSGFLIAAGSLDTVKVKQARAAALKWWSPQVGDSNSLHSRGDRQNLASHPKFKSQFGKFLLPSSENDSCHDLLGGYTPTIVSNEESFNPKKQE